MPSIIVRPPTSRQLQSYTVATATWASSGGYTCLVAAAVAIATGCDRGTPRSPRQAADGLLLTAEQTAPPATPAETRKTQLIGDEPSANGWFVEVPARESGVDFAFHSGGDAKQYTLLETVGGGAAAFDFDGDDDLDLFLVGGGTISADRSPRIGGRAGRLYRNDGNWRFADVTAATGLDAAGGYSHGVAVADFDRDGDPDLFVSGYRQCHMWRNDAGVFRDITEAAGLQVVGWSTAAAWCDIDRDGNPDLYVAQYVDWSPATHRVCGEQGQGTRDVCPPLQYAGLADRLYRNRGDGSFSDVSQAAHLRTDGRGLGVLASDLNQDQVCDIYVANDAGENFLYVGDGRGGFQESALLAGAAGSEFGLSEGSMGVDQGDYNGDGRADIVVTNFELENNSLYRGGDNGVFQHATLAAGLAGSGFPYVGFGAALADLDGDGWEDLFIVNGNVFYFRGQHGYLQPPLLYRNAEGRGFVDARTLGGGFFIREHAGRGACAADLDDDGALDLVVVRQDAPVALLNNRLSRSGWTRLRLEGVRCDKEAIGARVSCVFRGRTLTRWVKSGAGYLSHADQRILFPSEGDQPLTVVVHWPSGDWETFSDCQPRRTNLLVQGQGDEPAQIDADRGR